jgi:adenylate cyclase
MGPPIEPRQSCRKGSVFPDSIAPNVPFYIVDFLSPNDPFSLLLRESPFPSEDVHTALVAVHSIAVGYAVEGNIGSTIILNREEIAKMELYADSIREGLLSLRFKDQSIEKAFITYNDLSNKQANRNGIIMSILAWGAVVLYAFLFYRNSLMIIAIPIFFLLYPYFIIQLILFSKPRFLSFYQLSCAIANCAAGIVTIFVFFIAIRDVLLGGIFFIGLPTFAFFVLRIRYNLAAIASLLYTAACQLAIVICGFYNIQILVVLSVCIWYIQFMALIAGRALETAHRHLFSEQNAKNALLTSMLPLSIAEELQHKGSSRPVRIESATILFSDFVHFTSATKGIEPISVISLLNGYFTAFDSMTKNHHIERLKTIGDGYMCAGGIPDKSNTHPIDVCLMALEMLKYVKEQIQKHEGISWDIRIGINTGAVTAGIIGSSKFSYDIWGEAVNMASRHESSGIEGGINVSKGTYLLTKGFFDFKARGQIEIKGGEKLDMFQLLGIRQQFLGAGGLTKEFHEMYGKILGGELLLGYDI